MATTTRRLAAQAAGDPIPAAGYVRVSSALQDRYSPETQEEKIRAFASQHGFNLVLVTKDVQSGRKLTRQGYQELLDAVHGRVVRAVIVFMFDRWGRDAGEWITRLGEMERLGVEFISVQEGRDSEPFMRGVRGLLAEQYSRTLAKHVRPGRENGARTGTHMGPTPHLGYRRIYREHEGVLRQQAGELVEDPATAWVVRALFRRYAAGEPLRDLAEWLNTDPRCPRPARAAKWTRAGVGLILHNPLYAGKVQYNRKPCGFYERAAEGSMFVVPGKHAALIDLETFDLVQGRLDEANRYRTRNRLPDRPLPLGAGLMRCRGCGGPMTPSRRRDESHKHGLYRCRDGNEGVSRCLEPAYMMDLAHTALTEQVKRLRGRPWRTEAVQAEVVDQPEPDGRATLQRALAGVKEEMVAHQKYGREVLLTSPGGPTPQELAIHRETGVLLAGRMAALERQLGALPPTATAPSVEARRQFHERLADTSIAEVVDELAAQGDLVGLRDLVRTLVQTARIVERVPATRSKWLRAQVEWTEDVAWLLERGMLTLAPDLARPHYPATAQEILRERRSRYWARKKAGLIGVVPPARSGVVQAE